MRKHNKMEFLKTFQVTLLLLVILKNMEKNHQLILQEQLIEQDAKEAI